MQLDQTLFPLNQTPHHYSGPKPVPHVSTFVRWALRGVGRDRVKLETVKVGGRRYTSRAALDRFIAQLTGVEAIKEQQDRQRASDLAQAEHELEREGI
jgi:Protein of unknown function (DUF1580)